jgi:hypothetical protein
MLIETIVYNIDLLGKRDINIYREHYPVIAISWKPSKKSRYIIREDSFVVIAAYIS